MVTVQEPAWTLKPLCGSVILPSASTGAVHADGRVGSSSKSGCRVTAELQTVFVVLQAQ